MVVRVKQPSQLQLFDVAETQDALSLGLGFGHSG